jgi:hypothetical protein
MKSVVRPELPTASAGSSQAPTAAVDNSAPRSTHLESTYKSGKAVQITGTTSVSSCGVQADVRSSEPAGYSCVSRSFCAVAKENACL